jgi:uncharacterized delta-60 repeat protein
MKQLISLAIVLLCCFNTQAQYQDGLDPTFGTKGIVTKGSSIMYDDWGIWSALLQPDGKIVVSLSNANHIIRFNADGSIDNSFGTHGFFADSVRYTDGTAVRKLLIGYITIQSSGKIVAAGGDNDKGIGFLFRINTDGTLDTTFGTRGMALGDGGVLLAQPDDKILSTTYYSSDYYQRLSRYLPNGTIDSSFGIYGKVVNPSAKIGTGVDMALMPDGRIVAMYDYFGAARYMPDGSLDTTFNHTGMASIFSGFSSPYPHAIAVRPDGKVWVAGHGSWSATVAYFILARFNADGSIDTSFDPTGYKEYAWDTGAENKCRDMLLQPDGKVVLGGRVMNSVTTKNNFALLRIWPDGRTDSTFGDNGKRFTQVSGAVDRGDELYKMLLQPDGKLIALGTTIVPLSSGTTLMAAMARYSVDSKTGITEIPNQQRAVSVYPNPSTGTFQLLHAPALQSLQLYDLQGRLLKQWSQPAAQTVFDIAELAPALYLLRINATDNSHLFTKLNYAR